MSEFDPIAWGAIPVEEASNDPVSWEAVPVASAPDSSISVNNVARSAATGVPIIGGLLNKANAATNAALAPVLNPLFKPEDQLSGESFGQRYDESLRQQNATDKAFAAEHPVVDTVAQLTGGVAATLPIAATALGAKALGLSGKTLPQQIARGLASGAAIGGTDSAARGQGVGVGAGLGGLLGGGAPIAGRAVGAVYQGAKGLMTTPKTPANFTEVMLPNGTTAQVPLSRGQVMADVDGVMVEQAALRGGMGEKAQHVAQEFTDRQRGALDDASDKIGRSLEPTGANIANSVQEAGELASQGVRGAAETAKTAYKSAYDKFGALPGEFESAAFDKIGTSIRSRLTDGAAPVFVDDVTTPFASRALKDIDHTLGGVRIDNEALPFAKPPSDTFSIQDMDLARKRLNTMYEDAKSNPVDKRAVGRIIQAFDDHVETALDSKLFSGDETAYETLKGARKAFADYQKTFKPQGPGDEVGRVMQKITGRYDGQEATPTEVANYLYGANNVGSKGLSVRVAARVKEVLGENSPEWSAIRQGLWSKLVEPAEGMTGYGSQKKSERIFKFLNGDGRPLAQQLYSPQELDAMRQFATTLKTVTPLPGTVNYSNTAPVLKKIMSGTAKHGAAMAGLGLAGPAGAIAGYAGTAAAKGLGGYAAGLKIARQLNGPAALKAVDLRFKKQAADRASTVARGSEPSLQKD